MTRFIFFALLFSLSGCRGQRATRADCERIVDRIVALELLEQGFHDPVLQARTEEHMRQELRSEIDRCTGLPMRPDALQCAERARSAEDIVHRCLR